MTRWIILLSLMSMSSALADETRSNILFIMADDLGPEWLSCYGGQEHQTLRIDRLAEGGMRFENAYATPLCTPTRNVLLTGRYPFRTGWTVHHDTPRWGGQHLDPKREVTFARMLRTAGYATAIAGKWQINDLRVDPDILDKHGFDEHCMWVGGHKVVFDPDAGKFYMFYRVRRPLGKGRGGQCHVAESTDGVTFTSIWSATKEQLDAKSIEVGSLIRDPVTGMWRLYLSYQAVGGPWRVDLIEADHPRHFNAWHHRTVMLPDNYGLTSIKDPSVYIVGGLHVAFVCVPARQRYEEDASGCRHPLGDDATAMLTSPDGVYFRSFKYIFEPGGGDPGDWGRFRARISSVIYLPPVYVVFFGDTFDKGVPLPHSGKPNTLRRVVKDERPPIVIRRRPCPPRQPHRHPWPPPEPSREAGG